MKIYTSYFANRKIPEDIVKISISQFPPRGWSGPEYKKLAPPQDLLKKIKEGNCNRDFYIAEFKEKVLSRLDKEEVKKEFEIISSGRDIALLCYESLKTPDDFCHRILVREWLNAEEWKEESLSDPLF